MHHNNLIEMREEVENDEGLFVMEEEIKG